jgi:hypothetical protein
MDSPGYSLQFTLHASYPQWRWREWEAEVDRFKNGPVFLPNAYITDLTNLGVNGRFILEQSGIRAIRR